MQVLLQFSLSVRVREFSVPLFTCPSTGRSFYICYLLHSPKTFFFLSLGLITHPFYQVHPFMELINIPVNFSFLFLSTAPFPSPLKTRYSSTQFSCSPFSSSSFACSQSHLFMVLLFNQPSIHLLHLSLIKKGIEPM